MRKKIAYFLLACMVTPAICGCTTRAGTTEPTDTTPPTEQHTPQGVSLLSNDGTPAYRIVRDEDSSDIVTTAVVGLRASLNEKFEASFTLTTDYLMKNESADDIYEILVGMTNRAESVETLTGLSVTEYRVAVVGKKIVIGGGSDYATKQAIAFFLTLFADEHTLAAELDIKNKTQTSEYLLGVTNQGESCVEVFDAATGVLDEASRLWRYSMPYYNIADVKLRTHSQHGEVVLSVCGNNYACMVTYPGGELVWSTNAAADNPHSIELLPNNVIAVASSTGNALRFFDLVGSSTVYTEVVLQDAHGVLWDQENQIMWALGRNVLTAYTVVKGEDGVITVSEVADRRAIAPGDYGHDLSPVYGDTNQLWLTTSSAVLRFDKTTKTFSSSYEGSSVINRASAKSIGNFNDGSVALTVPDGDFKSWTTATLNLIYKNDTRYDSATAVSATGDFYKCRVWYSAYQ